MNHDGRHDGGEVWTDRDTDVRRQQCEPSAWILGQHGIIRQPEYDARDTTTNE